MAGGLLGSDFSADFAYVILAINAIVMAIVLVGVFLDEIARACAKALKHALSALVFLKAHLGLPHKQ